MIYASDLDRTLIYSQSFINLHPTETELLLVDKSKVDSFISKDVTSSLERVNNYEELKFIPVTSRSIDEYNRISIPNIRPEYVITTGGGKILHNGRLLQEWEDVIQKEIDIRDLEEIRTEIDKLESTNYQSKIIDGVYLFSKSSNIDLSKIELKQLGIKYPHYKFYIDKCKLYAIPRVFGKDTALTWLKHYLNEEFIIASGDSTFDIPMLNMADISIIPSHNSIEDSELRNMKYIEVTGGVVSPLQTLQIVENEINKF